MTQPRFSVGAPVIDRDGFTGTVTNVTHHDGAHWYDVRIMQGTRIVGEAVRYDSDLSPNPRH